ILIVAIEEATLVSFIYIVILIIIVEGVMTAITDLIVTPAADLISDAEDQILKSMISEYQVPQGIIEEDQIFKDVTSEDQQTRRRLLERFE
ncbi:10899_t:CDS:2, partial [Funneliformis caledonium]